LDLEHNVSELLRQICFFKCSRLLSDFLWDFYGQLYRLPQKQET
jgi:hypothetical protein